MDEYVDWIEDNLRHCDYARALRQKQIEERIVRPFRIPSDPDAKPVGEDSGPWSVHSTR